MCLVWGRAVLSWTISPPRPHTLNSTSMSKAYQSTFTGETNTPYSKQFVHSKSSQYRRLRTEWKNNVYLARSRIQGLGLYAAKDLEKHTMVIEYIGTIIRNEVANRREKIYEEQVWAGRGAIMVCGPHLAKGQGAGLGPEEQVESCGKRRGEAGERKNKK